MTEDTMKELLAYVRENVTIEVAAYGDCTCDSDVPSTIPCAYCASISFNERTEEFAFKPEDSK